MIFQKFKKLSIWEQLGVIGSIASVIGLYAFFAPAPVEPIKKINNRDNNSGIIIEGDVNSGTIAGRDIINNKYEGVPQKVVDRLLKELDEKDIKLQARDSLITNWIQKYKDLESQLANRTDAIAKQAKAFLDNGNLEDAEKLFKQSLANKL